jgi:uncharacterized protein
MAWDSALSGASAGRTHYAAVRTSMLTDLQFWMLMGAVSVATSVLSGVLGMAGGMLLLGVLLLRLEPAVAIPVHGIVQLVSNASRAWFLRSHISRRVILPFALPLLPAAALGVYLLGAMPPELGRMLIGAFVLVATWRPAAPKKEQPMHRRAERFLPLGGALVGFFSTLVGATGPLIAPFIVALELSPQGTVATMAACQVFQHASKVAAFGLAGFDLQRHLLPALGLSSCAVLGSAVGTRWLARVPQAAFKRGVRIVLTLLSLELLISATFQLMPGASIEELEVPGQPGAFEKKAGPADAGFR